MPQAIPFAGPGAGSSSPVGPAGSGGGLLRVVSNSEVDAFDRAQQANKASARAPPTLDIGMHIRKMWDVFRNHRNMYGGGSSLNIRLLRAQRTFEGKYEPGKLAEIAKFGGSEVYSRLVAVKCRGASSLLRDVYLGADRPWDIQPQPDPPVPPEVKASILQLVSVEVQGLKAACKPIGEDQTHARVLGLMHAAEQAARRQAASQADDISDKVDDMLVAGRFYEALGLFIIDLPLFPFACLKGPIVRMTNQVTWVQGKAVVRRIPQMFWERVSPFDIYWSPGASNIADADVLERKRMTRSDLNDLIGLPGYDEKAVRAAIEDYNSGLREWLDSVDVERAINEGRENPSLNQSMMIDALEFHGQIRGDMLLQQGLSKAQVPDPDLDYAVQSWVVGRHTIKTQINPSPRQRHPYFITSFEKVPGTVAGHALPDLLEDIQEICNSALRNLSNNMCLTGDTLVYRHPRPGTKGADNHAGVGAKRQIKAKAEISLLALWDGAQHNNRGLKRNIIRALDPATGEIIGQRIDAIHDNGVQDVYEMTTARGYCIKATATHRFLADDGAWLTVEKFKCGDLIGVNGAVVQLPRMCRDCGSELSRPTAVRCRPCADKMRSAPGSWNDFQAQDAVRHRDVSATTARGRKLVRDQLKAACENCGTADRLHVHHRDNDPWNCDPANLNTFCEPCHKAWHIRHSHFGDAYKHRFLDFDRVVGIRYVGRERTFCLTMQGHPNFVANGLISHNSIASGPQVLVNDDMLSPNENGDELYPWKRWHVQSDPMGSPRPPVSFFQPQSNSQELLAVYTSMSNLADELSAIPRYITGSSQNLGGAGRTASGLSMLMGNAEKVLQTVAANIDNDVMEPLLGALYEMIMLTDTTGMLSGEEKIRVRGVNVAVQKETERQKQLQFLQITANPIDAPIVGQMGRARVLRSIALGLGLPDDIVPDDETLQAQMDAQKQMQAAQASIQAGAQEGTPQDPTTQPPAGTPGAPPASPGAQAQGNASPSPGPAQHSDNAPPVNLQQQGLPT